MIVGYAITDTIGKAVKDEYTTVYKTWEEAMSEASKRADNLVKEFGKEATKISLINSKSKKSCDEYGYTSSYKIMLKGVGDVCVLYIIPVRTL